MASSGFGSSHDAAYRDCQTYYYWQRKRGIQPLGASTAPPLLVGSAGHKYAEVLINAWLAGEQQLSAVLPEALAAYYSVLGELEPEDVAMRERDSLARCVLPIWATGKWQRFLEGIERPIGTEIQLSIDLPAETEYGPIRPELRTYTVRLDYVWKREDDSNTIEDHKLVKAMSPAEEAKTYLASDQHKGYIGVWNANKPEDKAHWLAYSFLRLHPKVTSPSAFHVEERNVDDAQLADWYQRMLHLRAELSGKWDKPKVWWVSNTAPHGPCYKFGRACAYRPLCDRPAYASTLVETGYEAIPEENV